MKRRAFLAMLGLSPAIGVGAMLRAPEKQPNTKFPYMKFWNGKDQTELAMGEGGTLWIGDGRGRWRKVATE